MIALIFNFYFFNYIVYYLFIEGVGGNLVAIQSSRMSTYLHKNKNTNKLSSSDSKNCNSIFGTFFGKSMSFTSIKTLSLCKIFIHFWF